MAAYLLIRGGEGGQNIGKSAYIILERSLNRSRVSKRLKLSRIVISCPAIGLVSLFHSHRIHFHINLLCIRTIHTPQ